MSLANILTKVSDLILSDVGQKVIKNTGLALFTYGATQLVFSQAMNVVYQYWSGLGSVFYLFGISGADVALSMVLSAIAVRVAMNSAKVGVTKA